MIRLFYFAILSCTFFALISCTATDSEVSFEESFGDVTEFSIITEMNYSNENSEALQVNANYKPNKAKGNGNIIMHPMRDSRTGQITAYVPLPANWDITGPAWKGPGNTIVEQRNGGSALSTQRIIQNADQILREEVIPAIRQDGYREGRVENHPTIASFDENLYNQYVKYGQSQSWFEVKSVDFSTPQGKRGMVIVHLTTTANNFGKMYMYQFQIMVCDGNRFEQSKADLLYALANMKMDPQVIAAYNAGERNRLAANDAAFNRKMAARDAQFNNYMASQRSNSYDALDSSMDSWRRRNGMNDRGHEMAVDAINGQTQVTSPYDGNTYKVDDYSNHYYMNQWGEYISTDDHFYNPNMDPYTNNQDWSEVNPDDYNY